MAQEQASAVYMELGERTARLEEWKVAVERQFVSIDEKLDRLQARQDTVIKWERIIVLAITAVGILFGLLDGERLSLVQALLSGG